MKKRTVLTILAFVLLIAAVAVPSVLLTEKAEADTTALTKYGDFALINDSNSPYNGGHVITSSTGWGLFMDHISGNTVSGYEYANGVKTARELGGDLYGNGDDGNGNGKYYLLADVSVPSAFNDENLDTRKRNFKGEFDGNMYTISIGSRSFDLDDSSSDANYNGALFTYLCGYVHDLYVRVGKLDVTNTSLYNGENVGIIAGQLEFGANVERVAILQDASTGGYLKYSDNDKNCDVDVGIICGYASSPEVRVTEVYTNVPVSISRTSNYGGHNFVGGLIGSCVSGLGISHCYAEGAVNSSVRQDNSFQNELYTAGLVGNTRDNSNISYCVANNGQVTATSTSTFYGNSNSSVIAGATTGGGNLYTKGIYTTVNTLNNVLASSGSYWGTTKLITKVFAFRTAGSYTTSLPDYTLSDVTTAAGLINTASGTSKWSVDGSALKLTWMMPKQPTASYDRSNGIVSITRDALYTMRNLYYNITMTIQGKMAAPKALESPSEDQKEITRAEMYWGLTSKADAEAFQSGQTAYSQVPNLSSEAQAVGAGKKLYFVLELGGTNITSDDITADKINIVWTLTNLTNSQTALLPGGILDWDNLATGTGTALEYQAGDILKVAGAYSSAGTALGTVEGFFTVEAAAKGVKLKQGAVLPDYKLPGDSVTLDFYEAEGYGVAADDVVYTVADSSSAATDISTGGVLTIASNEVGKRPAGKNYYAVTIKAAAKDKDSSGNEISTTFDIPIYQVPTEASVTGRTADLTVGQSADTDNTWTAGLKYANLGGMPMPVKAVEWDVKWAFVSGTSGFHYTTDLMDNTVTQPESTMNIVQSIDVNGAATLTTRDSGKVVYSAAVTYGLYPKDANGKPDMTQTAVGGLVTQTGWKKTATNAADPIYIVPTLSITGPAAIYNAGNYTYAATLSGGAAGTYIYTVTTTSVTGSPKPTIGRNNGVLTVGTGIGGELTVNTALSATTVTGKDGSPITPAEGIKRGSMTVALGSATVSCSPAMTDNKIEITDAERTFTLTATAPSAFTSPVWAWEVTDEPTGSLISLTNGSTNAATLTVPAQGASGSYEVKATATDNGRTTSATYKFWIEPGGRVTFDPAVENNALPKSDSVTREPYTTKLPDTAYLGGATGTWNWSVVSGNGVFLSPAGTTSASYVSNNQTGAPTLYVGKVATAGTKVLYLTGVFNYTAGGESGSKTYTLGFTIAEPAPSGTAAWQGIDGLVSNLLGGLEKLEAGTLFDGLKLEPVVVAAAEAHSDRCMGSSDKDYSIRLKYDDYADPHDADDDLMEKRVAYFVVTKTFPSNPSNMTFSVDSAVDVSTVATGDFIAYDQKYMDVIGSDLYGKTSRLNVGTTPASFYVTARVTSELALRSSSSTGSPDQSERLMADSNTIVWFVEYDSAAGTFKAPVTTSANGDINAGSLPAEVSTAAKVLTQDLKGTRAVKTVNQYDQNGAWESWNSSGTLLRVRLTELINNVFPEQSGKKVAGTLKVETWMDDTDVSTSEITLGERPSVPTFTPGAGETIDYNTGVTISCRDSNTKIYYIIYYDTTYAELGNPELTPATDGVLEYTGASIPFPMDKNKMTIAAIAVNNDAAAKQSFTSYIDYSNSNRQSLPAVTAQAKEGTNEAQAFAPTAEYNTKNGFAVYLDSAAFYYGDAQFTGKIYYTSDGKEPTNLIYDGVYTLDDLTAGNSIKLPGNMKGVESMTVKAIYIADSLIESIEAGTMTYTSAAAEYFKSQVSTFEFNFASAYSKPEVYSAYVEEASGSAKVNVGNLLGEDVTVAEGQQIVFGIPDRNFEENMLPTQAEKGQVVTGVDPDTGAVVTEAAEDTEFVDSYVLLNVNYETPLIKYRIAASEDDLAAEPSDKSDWKTYDSSKPKIVYYTKTLVSSADDENPEDVYSYSATVINKVQPEVLTVSGSGTIYYQIYLDGSNSSFYSGEILTQKFTIRSVATPPSAEPSGTQEKPYAINVKESISLVANNENTTIFYTLSSTSVDYQARIDWDTRYNEWLNGGEDTAKKREQYAITEGDPEPTTYRYDDEAIIVTKNKAMYLYINALEVSNGDFDDDPYMMGSHSPSPTAKFRYTINKLEVLSDVVATPETKADSPTELSRGETIILSNESNTDIYYTVNGSSPSIDDRTALNEAIAYLNEYGDSYLTGLSERKQELLANFYVNGVDTLPTKIYNASEKVVMDPQGADTVMIINAIAVEKDGDKENSAMGTFYYQLGKVEPVEATVVAIETNGDVTTLAPGSTISLRSSTPGAEIYYTINESVPDPDSYGTTGSATLKYDSGKGITMPKDISTFYTIRAVAVTPLNASGLRSYANSDLATFIYQLPAPVQAVYATPIAGTVVKGTEVTLKTTTADATIYYETGKAANLKANKSQTFEEGTPIVIEENMTIYTMAVKNGVESEVTSFKYIVAETLPTPVPSIATGSMVGNGTSVKLTSKEGATIVYTTDGSDPTKADNANLKYGSAVLLSGSGGATVSVQAYATMTGYTPSEIMTATYTIATAEGYLTVSPATGSTVANGTVVNMTTTLSGSTIRYTTDGTDPTANSPSGNSVTITGEPGSTVNLKVSVFDSSGNPGTTTLVTYTIQAKASAPSSSVESGAYFMDGAAIKLTAAEGLIYYTTDGSDPTTSSSLYGDIAKLGNDITAYPSITLRDSVVLKAIAVVEGKANSDIAQFVYTKAGQVSAPEFSKTSGEIDQNSEVALTTSTEGASIYYTTKGTDPDPDNLNGLTLYTGPINVTRPVTIKAIAVKDKLHSSVANSATYTVKVPEPEDEGGANGELPGGTSTDRLSSRRTYSDTDTGPKYTDVIVTNTDFGMLVSAPAGVIPKDCELIITEMNPGNQDVGAVSSVNDYAIAQLYEIKLMRNGEEIQPEGVIEIGMPIEAKYQNATLELVQINANGTGKALDARRAGGMAYVETDSLYRVAITMPEDQIVKDNTWIWVAAVAGVGLVGGGTAALLVGRKKKNKQAAKPSAGARPQPPAQQPPQGPQPPAQQPQQPPQQPPRQ